MTIISGSEVAVIPKRFSGIRVLLIEPDHTSLVQHAYILSQNSYRVTSTTRVSTGLSMLQNGHLYDCILVDVDMREMDMMKFVHQVLRRQPELSVVVMVSDDIHMMRFYTESVKNDGITCLLKPCNLNEICNIWKHVCRKWITPSEKHDSNGNSPYTNNNIIRRGDPRFKPFPVLSRAMMGNVNNNNILSGSTMFKPIYLNNFISNEVGSSSTARNIDYKGKQPMIMDNRQPLEEEDDVSQEKGTDGKRRIYWTKALHGKFLEALNVLGKENAYPSEILKHMKVPGLTRTHVASHLQKLQEGKKVMKRPRLVPVVETTGDNLQAGSKRSMKLTLSTNHNLHQGPSKKLNSQGMSYMSLDNIKARLQDQSALLLPAIPHPTTTTVSNNSVNGDQVTDHNSGDTFQLPVVETSKISSPPTSGTSEDGSNFSDALTPLLFDNYHSIDASGCGAMGEPLAEFDCFGIPIEKCQMIEVGSVEDHGLGGIEPWMVSDEVNRGRYFHGTLGGTGETLNFSGAGTDGVETPITNESEEDLALHEFVSIELGGFSHPQDNFQGNGDNLIELGGFSQPQDNFQGNGDNLFMGFVHDHSEINATDNGFPNLEVAENGVDFSFPAGEGSNNEAQIPAYVNSNMLYLGGVEVEEARVIFDHDDPFPVMTDFDVEKTMQILNEVDFGDLIDEEWQFPSVSS